jgi:hypothetical protein
MSNGLPIFDDGIQIFDIERDKWLDETVSPFFFAAILAALSASSFSPALATPAIVSARYDEAIPPLFRLHFLSSQSDTESREIHIHSHGHTLAKMTNETDIRTF